MIGNERALVRLDGDDGEPLAGHYLAIALKLPGCSAVGETREEAMRELDDAVEAWIVGMRAVGNPIPGEKPR